MKIHKGDTVQIISGKERGKGGKVIDINPKHERIIVEGLNLYKKRVRPKKQGEKGEVVSVPRALHASNAMLICPNCKKPSRVGYRFEGDQKVRHCKRCETAL